VKACICYNTHTKFETYADPQPQSVGCLISGSDGKVAAAWESHEKPLRVSTGEGQFNSRQPPKDQRRLLAALVVLHDPALVRRSAEGSAQVVDRPSYANQSRSAATSEPSDTQSRHSAPTPVKAATAPTTECRQSAESKAHARHCDADHHFVLCHPMRGVADAMEEPCRSSR
jgi:hypothetical protein